MGCNNKVSRCLWGYVDLTRDPFDHGSASLSGRYLTPIEFSHYGHLFTTGTGNDRFAIEKLLPERIAGETRRIHTSNVSGANDRKGGVKTRNPEISRREPRAKNQDTTLRSRGGLGAFEVAL
jgi:hypothetical protein